MNPLSKSARTAARDSVRERTGQPTLTIREDDIENLAWTYDRVGVSRDGRTVTCWDETASPGVYAIAVAFEVLR